LLLKRNDKMKIKIKNGYAVGKIDGYKFKSTNCWEKGLCDYSISDQKQGVKEVKNLIKAYKLGKKYKSKSKNQ